MLENRPLLSFYEHYALLTANNTDTVTDVFKMADEGKIKDRFGFLELVMHCKMEINKNASN